MSLIAGVITVDWLCISYDGRAIRDGKIVSEDIQKVIRLNKYTCVGATGTLEFALTIFEILKNVDGFSQMRCDKVAMEICRILKQPNVTFKSGTFLTAGLNSSGKMAAYTIGTDLVASPQIPKISGELKCLHLGSEMSPIKIDAFIADGLLKRKTIPAIIADYIRTVAAVDYYVNTNVKTIILTRQDLLRI